MMPAGTSGLVLRPVGVIWHHRTLSLQRRSGRVKKFFKIFLDRLCQRVYPSSMKTKHGKQIRVSHEIHRRLKMLAVAAEEEENLYNWANKILGAYLDRVDAAKARRDGRSER